MTTIDDLTISLTIKDNSNLDKLRKNLDSMIKSGGFQPGGVAGGEVGKTTKSIAKEIQELKQHIYDYVLPISTGGLSGTAQAMHASQLIGIASEWIEDIAKGLKPVKSSAIDALMENFNVTTNPELHDKLKDKINNWIGYLDRIAHEEWTGPGAERAIKEFRSVLDTIGSESGLKKSLITSMDVAMGEFNKEIATLFRKAGIKTASEVGLFEFKDRWFTELNEDAKDKILGKIRKDLPEALPKLQDARDILEKNPDVWKGINEAITSFGIVIEQDMVKNAQRLKDDPNLAAIYYASLEKMFEDEKGFLIEGWKNHFAKLAGSDIIKDAFEYVRPDIVFMQATEEALKKIGISQEVIDKITAKPIFFAELKNILSSENIAQISKYESMVGEIVVLTNQVMTSFTDVKDTSVELINVMSRLQELEAIRAPMTKEANKELTEELSKKLVKTNLEEIDAKLDGLGKKIDGTLTEEELKTIFSKVDNLQEKIEKLYGAF